MSVAHRGDIDVAAIGSLFADPGRCRILLALDDGRALPATRLAAEAEVTPATASTHLGKLVAGGLLTVESHGRHRYYRISGPQVGRLIEDLAQLAPAAPVRSLRQGERAHALREARTCYDHLAGRLGVALMSGMVDAGFLVGDDATLGTGRTPCDPPVGHGHDVDYRLTDGGSAFLTDLGVAVPERPVIRYCIDWSEQRHHLAGVVGRSLLRRFTDLGWVRRSPTSRAVLVTETGRRGMQNSRPERLRHAAPRRGRASTSA